EVRLHPATLAAPRFHRWASLAAAAAVLAGTFAVVLYRAPWSAWAPGQARSETPLRELVRAFLDGSDQASAEARRQLVARGPAGPDRPPPGRPSQGGPGLGREAGLRISRGARSGHGRIAEDRAFGPPDPERKRRRARRGDLGPLPGAGRRAKAAPADPGTASR